MRKIIGAMALAAILTTGVTAFAATADYDNHSTNQVNVNDVDDYSTVLIVKVPDNADLSGSLNSSDIVYINQADGTFGDLSGFLIKENPAYGKYKMQLGASSGPSATPVYFYIGVDTPAEGDNDAMVRLGEELVPGDGWKVGCYTETADMGSYHSLKVAFINNGTPVYGGYDLSQLGVPTITGATAKLAFQINHVPEEFKDSLTMFLSSDEVSKTTHLPEAVGSR